MRLRYLFVLAFLLFACNHESAPTAPAVDAMLTGRAMTPSGAPVPNVQLTLEGGGTTSSANTGADGSFTFQNMPPGTYNVKIGTRRAGSLRLVRGNNVHDLLVTDCIVPHGVVRDARTGRPLAGARVRIHSMETTTNAAGWYQVDFGCAGVPGSTITLSASRSGYQTAEQLSRASFLCGCSFDFFLDPL